jgi:hypothetical protein hydSNDRAFT_0623
MDNIVVLSGTDYESDKELIESEVKNRKIFVLHNQDIKLNLYLDYMFTEFNVKNSDLCKLKICRQFEFERESVSVSIDGKTNYVSSVLSLLQMMDPNKKAVITIENDNRTLLAEIMQQLVYIEYSISDFEIRLRKEVRDAERTDIFTKNIDEILQQITIADENIYNMEADDNLKEIVERIGELYSNIKKQVEKAKSIEMKIAVAASKKTGKSVIANCMFGMELAPTSLEMATPNTCIYRKSKDDKFRVIVGSDVKEFKDKYSIRKYIGDEFRKAQNDTSSKFAIEDMIIEYPTNKNNFESYTIYDTPGPDAAGTDHFKSTEKAMDECDVAIFAIDFSKYLTSSEEEFLKKVKEIFETKGKFHTLIFCLNKIDMMFQDKEAKSKIKIIEFIRNRLKDIDSKYSDCVIFATSALDYFNVIEIEEKEKDNEALRGISTSDLRDMDDFFERVNDDEITTILTGIDKEATNLRRQLGYKEITANTVKDFSGIPQLLSYVSYIAKNKARGEIVNSITYDISRAMGKIREELKYRDFLEQYMQANEDKKAKIKEILAEYEIQFQKIAKSSVLTKDDKDYIDSKKSNGFLYGIIKEIDKKREIGNQLDKSDIELREIFTEINVGARISNHDKDHFTDETIARLRDTFLKKYDEHIKSNGGLEGKIVSADALDITGSDIEKAFKFMASRYMEVERSQRMSLLINCISDIRDMLANRFEILQEKREQCKNALERNDIKFDFMSIPVFAPAFDIKQVDEINARLSAETNFNIGANVEKDKLWKIHQWWRNIWSGESDKREMKVTLHFKNNMLKALDSNDLKKTIYNIIDHDLVPVLDDNLEKLRVNVNKAANSIMNQFKDINDINSAEISESIKKIDETEDLEAMNLKLAIEKQSVDKIAELSVGFLQIWDMVEKGQAIS